MKRNGIYRADAMAILRDKDFHKIKAWKKNGEIIELKDVTCITHFQRQGTMRLKLPNGQIRMLRECNIFCVDDMMIYL